MTERFFHVDWLNGEISLREISLVITMTLMSWVFTPSGVLKTILAGAMGVLGGLLSLEVGPMTGLLLMIMFEAATDLFIIERKHPEGHALAGKKIKFLRRLGQVAASRFWVILCMLMGVIYANASGIHEVKTFLIVVCGGVLLLVGWIRAGKKAPIINLMADALLTKLRGHGLELSVEDEEGRALKIQGAISEVALPGNAPTVPQTAPVEPPATEDPPVSG